MFFTSDKGITLEQYKEPMFSKEIIRLKVCDMAKKEMEVKVCQDPDEMSCDDILFIAREAKVTDEYDGKILWKKIMDARDKKITSVIIDAIDDEPYISSQISPAMKLSEKLSKGAALIKKAVGAENIKLEVYKNFTDLDTKIPNFIGNVKVDFVGGRYPVERRSHIAKRKKNAVIFGACSLIALYDAVYQNLCHTTCFLTVAGDCITNPANYEVPIGYPLSDVLNDAGLIAEPKRIVVGGSMTGVAVTELEKIGISPTTRGILAFHNEFKKLEEPCIGCGRCTNVCPQNLSPYYIYQVMNSENKDNLLLFDADRCISCGLCSYICPAKLELQQTVQLASELTKKIKEEQI